jgi:hypothetical protein
MKSIYVLPICAMLIVPSIAHMQVAFTGENEGNLSLTCDAASFGHTTISTPQGEAWLLTLPDGAPLLRAGAPDLPRIAVPLIVDDTRNMEVSIIASEFVEYSDIDVAPSRGNLYRTTDPAALPLSYGAVYSANEFYPGTLAALDEPFIQGVVRGQTLHFYPLQYNPVTRVLRHYTHLEVVVKVTELPGANALTQGNQRVNALLNETYAGRYLNYDPSRYDVVGELGNMLVITDGDYLDELAPWVQWKKEKGIATEVVDVADIGTTVSAINAFVENYYNDNGLTYLVLVGDEIQIPTLLVNNGGGQGYCDACYGYIAGTDSYAEIHVGRIIVHTETELPGVITKILEYEKTPYVATDWFSVAMGIGSNEGDGIGDDDEADWQHQNEIKEDLLSFTYSSVWEKYDGNHNASSPTGGETADNAGSPPASTLTDVIENGCSLINYTGHGSHTSILTGSYNNAQINALTNFHLYPYFIVVGCCTGDFDDDDASGDTFGEAWLKSMDGSNPAGGIGGAFSSVYQSWAPPMEGQDEMVHIISGLAGYETRHTLGSIHTNGCASMNDVYGNDGDEMTDTWHLFGDPTIQLRTAYPSNIDVDHLSQVFFGTSEIEIACNVESAMVCITREGEILGWGIASGGSVSIEIPTLIEPAELLVTATAFNTVPSQTYIEVVPADGPYVIDEDQVLDDSAGNNNGQADYGETVLLDVSLNNVGIETATGVTAVLSTADPNVTITDNIEFYGDVNPGDIPVADNAYAFEVADGVTDGHVVNFVLEISDDQLNTWTMDFNVILNAPELVCPVTIEVNDSAGNGNGRIESGETVEISVTLSNQGHADALNTLGNLSTSSEYLTIPEPAQAMGMIDAAGSAVAVFTAIAAADIPDGTNASMVFEASAGLYNTACTFEKTLDVIIEDSETGVIDGFNWQFDGDQDWFVTTQTPYEGDYCMQSGDIGNNQVTTLKTTMTILEAGNIEFSYRTDSESGFDFLIFNINGNTLGQWSGESDWTEVSFPVNPGNVTFRWRYDKDDVVSSGLDACWIDNIIFPPYEQAVTVVETETDADALAVFPNPADETATVSFTLAQASDVSMVLTGMRGEQVWAQPASHMAEGNQRVNLPLQQLAAGIYLLRVNTYRGDQVVKVVVE